MTSDYFVVIVLSNLLELSDVCPDTKLILKDWRSR